MSSVLGTRVLLARLVSGSLLAEAAGTGDETPPTVGSPKIVTRRLPPGVAQAVRGSEPARRGVSLTPPSAEETA